MTNMYRLFHVSSKYPLIISEIKSQLADQNLMINITKTDENNKLYIQNEHNQLLYVSVIKNYENYYGKLNVLLPDNLELSFVSSDTAEKLEPGKTYFIDMPDGKLMISPSTDSNHTGVTIEFISDNETKFSDYNRSKALIEKVYDKENKCYGPLQCLLWTNPYMPDASYYTQFTDYCPADETKRIAAKLTGQALTLINNFKTNHIKNFSDKFYIDGKRIDYEIRIIETEYENKETGETITETPFIDFRTVKTSKEIYDHAEFDKSEILKTTENFVIKIRTSI